MNQFSSHNKTLRDLIEHESFNFNNHVVNLDSIDLVLRECLSIEEMREAGSFFTGQNLATVVIKTLSHAITFDSIVFDPTCGAGNLLIECSRSLGVEETLSQTLAKWGKVLWGYDLYDSFIESTKLRLIIEALSRGVVKDCTLDDALSMFPNIIVRDIWTAKKEDLVNVTHAVINPPFTLIKSPNKFYWNAGKINAAGILFDHFLRILPINCCFSAILPDVLRSGSRYSKFREFCSLKSYAETKIIGRFNNKTDVDVFLLYGRVVEESDQQIFWYQPYKNSIQLSEKYNVCVGPLVAYRDPEIGNEYLYIHSKNVPAWETISKINEKRKFKGRVISSPFIVVKRTSSPNDKNRAVATIINVKDLVAVENHLIVIKPKSGRLSECKKLLKILKSNETNNFLNERIRLRHLTVEALKSIPIKITP